MNRERFTVYNFPQLTTSYGKKIYGYYPPSLEGYEYYSKYIKKCKPYQVRSDKGRCVGRKSKSASRTGSDISARAMKLKHKKGISLKEAWKRLRFGYNPPNLVDYDWNPVTKRYNKKCGTGKVRNPSTGRCVSDGTGKKRTKSVSKVPKQVKGYRVELVIKPIGADQRIDLKGKNQAHNLKKLVEYYTMLLPSLEYQFTIINPKVNKRIVGDDGRIVFKYDHLTPFPSQRDAAIDMALSLDNDGDYPITTDGKGRILNIQAGKLSPFNFPNGIIPFQTLLLESHAATKNWKGLY
jgi:hypothetical protein